MFNPSFHISARAAQALMDIEVSRNLIATLPVSVQLLDSLRESARLTSTHYSTQIEGNRLTQQEVSVVAQGGTFPNRKRDEREVKNYFLALTYLDETLEDSPALVEVDMIQRIHGYVMEGKKSPSVYRDGQNVIRESGSGGIIYMPPEAKDVPDLMKELVNWINTKIEKAELPAPIIAGIAHYQFATIHPYYDGNGRTARLLTNLVLHLSGYGLKGIYSLEEYYAKNLQGYYDAISVGDSHNYYMGRAESDISHWIEYFCQGMADAFANVRLQAERLKETPDHNHLLRELDPSQKKVLSLFKQSRFITTREISNFLGVSSRTALNYCTKWKEAGFITQEGEKRNRRYELTATWLKLL